MADRIAVVPAYDYLQIPDRDLAGKLKARTAQIRRLQRDHLIMAIMSIGEELAGAHEDLAGAGCEGQFAPWVEAEFGFARKTAYNYLNAWKVFGPEVCNGYTLNFQATAMYRLASPETPKKAVTRALKLAERGKITDAVAKQLIEKYSPVVEAPLPDETRVVTYEPDQQGDGPGAPPESDPIAVRPPVESGTSDSGGPVSDGDPEKALKAFKEGIRWLPAMMYGAHRSALTALLEDLNERIGMGEG